MRLIYGFGLVSNFFIYQSTVTGIYNYRQRELLNMRHVPFPIKFAFSSAISGMMCYKLY